MGNDDKGDDVSDDDDDVMMTSFTCFDTSNQSFVINQTNA